jgi:hypothetical protein
VVTVRTPNSLVICCRGDFEIIVVGEGIMLNVTANRETCKLDNDEVSQHMWEPYLLIILNNHIQVNQFKL